LNTNLLVPASYESAKCIYNLFTGVFFDLWDAGNTLKACFTSPYVTGFAKRGLPQTSNLPTLTIHNFQLVQATDLKFGQLKVPTWLNGCKTFQLHSLFDSQVMVF